MPTGELLATEMWRHIYSHDEIDTTSKERAWRLEGRNTLPDLERQKSDSAMRPLVKK